jgi:FMN reductase
MTASTPTGAAPLVVGLGGTLGQLRCIGHALRAWLTPLGVAINSADKIWDESGELVDATVQDQLDILATPLLAHTRAVWETA